MSELPGLRADALSVLVDGHQLHITHLRAVRGRLLGPILMLPGRFTDARVFGDEQQGLAQYLARCGYDVYLPDPRGHGRSWPLIGAASTHGFHEVINQDLPALAARIASLRPGMPQIWICQGWASVWSTACYARHHASLPPIAGFMHLAPQRQVLARTWRQRWYYHGVLRGWGRLAAALLGYLPAIRWRMGNANESRAALRDYLTWSADATWRDTRDAFDYLAAARACTWPASLNFAATDDDLVGHAEEVRLFLRDLAEHDCRLLLPEVGGSTGLGQRTLCPPESFPLVLRWLRERATAAL